MKRITIALLALALSACAERRNEVTCDLSVESKLAFTEAGAEDSVSARLLGPGCDKAVALYVVSTADGHPIWSWSAPTAQAFELSFKDEEEAAAFLARWAQPNLMRAGALPEWPRRGAAPTGLHPGVDRTTYEDIRARDLPVLCHLSAVGRESCVFWEPAAAAAGLLLVRDVAAREAQLEAPVEDQ